MRLNIPSYALIDINLFLKDNNLGKKKVLNCLKFNGWQIHSDIQTYLAYPPVTTFLSLRHSPRRL